MERTPIDDETGIRRVVAELYSTVYSDSLDPEEIDLYNVKSEYVEAEIQLPYIGVNKRDWEEEWSHEKKLEVLLHEFSHIEETEDEPDHGPGFYDRLAELTEIAESHRPEIESIFGTSINFDEVERHILDSVNEYTVEPGIDTVEGRRNSLRKRFTTSQGRTC